MAVTADKPAPYAPASAILDIVDRFRNKGLPVPITAETLARAGVSDSLIPRTLQALQTLDLIGEDGRPTQVLEGIRRAPEAELKACMAEWLQGAYADALQFVDPATADEVGIRDAFRSYSPAGQQPRMVTLFSGLFRAAGIGPEKSGPASVAPSARVVTRPRPARSTRPPSSNPPTPPMSPPVPQIGKLPPALSGLLICLPTDGSSWTRTERDRFVQTFGAVLDFCFPIRAEGGLEDLA